MVTDHPDTPVNKVTLRSREPRWLRYLIDRYTGLRSWGGFILVFWLFAGMLLARFAEGFLRILGFVLLVLFVATYVYAAYHREDKAYPSDEPNADTTPRRLS